MLTTNLIQCLGCKAVSTKTEISDNEGKCLMCNSTGPLRIIGAIGTPKERAEKSNYTGELESKILTLAQRSEYSDSLIDTLLLEIKNLEDELEDSKAAMKIFDRAIAQKYFKTSKMLKEAQEEIIKIKSQNSKLQDQINEFENF